MNDSTRRVIRHHIEQLESDVARAKRDAEEAERVLAARRSQVEVYETELAALRADLAG